MKKQTQNHSQQKQISNLKKNRICLKPKSADSRKGQTREEEFKFGCECCDSAYDFGIEHGRLEALTDVEKIINKSDYECTFEGAHLISREELLREIAKERK